MEVKEKKQFKTPHTYVIIFAIVVLAWLLTFMIPAGKYTTQEMEYQGSQGSTFTRTVLIQDSFRYMHPLKEDILRQKLGQVSQNQNFLKENEVDQTALTDLLNSGETLTFANLEG